MSKSLKIEGKSYQIKKQRINRLLSEIEENSLLHHSEHLEKQAALLAMMLTKMDIKHIISFADTEPDFLEIFSEKEDKIDIRQIISYADTEPDFLEIFGETEDQVDDWRHENKARI